MTAHDELAREAIASIYRLVGDGCRSGTRAEIFQYVARVEAELARLTADTAELRAALTDELDNWNPERRPTITAERDEAIARAEAAESQLARLQDGLRQWAVAPYARDRVEALLAVAGLPDRALYASPGDDAHKDTA